MQFLHETFLSFALHLVPSKGNNLKCECKAWTNVETRKGSKKSCKSKQRSCNKELRINYNRKITKDEGKEKCLQSRFETKKMLWVVFMLRFKVCQVWSSEAFIGLVYDVIKSSANDVIKSGNNLEIAFWSINGLKRVRNVNFHLRSSSKNFAVKYCEQSTWTYLVGSSGSCLPSQLFHCLSSIIAARLVTNEQSLVIVCKRMISCVRRAAADVDAVGKLARESLRLDSVAMNKLVLVEDEPKQKRGENWIRSLIWRWKSSWQSFQRFTSDLSGFTSIKDGSWTAMRYFLNHFQLKTVLAMLKNVEQKVSSLEQETKKFKTQQFMQVFLHSSLLRSLQWKLLEVRRCVCRRKRQRMEKSSS